MNALTTTTHPSLKRKKIHVSRLKILFNDTVLRVSGHISFHDGKKDFCIDKIQIHGIEIADILLSLNAKIETLSTIALEQWE